MPKRKVLVKDAQLVPAETIWPGRCNAGDMVLTATLVTQHPMLGRSTAPIRSSLVVSMHLALGIIETRNTIYEVVQA